MKEEKQKNTESATGKIKELFLKISNQTDAIFRHNRLKGNMIKISFPDMYQHKFPEGKLLILSHEDLKEIINIVKSCEK